MKPINIFIAGNMAANPFYKDPNWRSEVYKELDKYIESEIINIDPIDPHVHEDDPQFVFGQDCYLIKNSDIVIVYLTDDISVGASQEMLIAKFFGKHLIGIAPLGGKFSQTSKELLGKIYNNWKHPFVEVVCDAVVGTVKEAAELIKSFTPQKNGVSKNIDVIDESINYYLENKSKYHSS